MSSIDFASLLKSEKRRLRRELVGPDVLKSGEGDCSSCSSGPEPVGIAPPSPPATDSDAGIPHPPLLSVSCSLLERFEVPSWAPEGLGYVDRFLTDGDASNLMSLVLQLDGWVHLPHSKRRVLKLCPPLKETAPQLLPLIDALPEGLFPVDRPPNHILVNHYTSDQGIMPHVDGPAYHPLTATLSLGSPALISFLERLPTSSISPDSPPKEIASVLMQPSSLLTFTGAYYVDMLHTVPEGPQTTSPTTVNSPPDLRVMRGARVSLTIRHALPDAL